MDEFSRMTLEQLEKEREQCRVDIKFSKSLGKNKAQLAARFNLLTRELNSRSE